MQGQLTDFFDVLTDSSLIREDCTSMAGIGSEPSPLAFNRGPTTHDDGLTRIAG